MAETGLNPAQASHVILTAFRRGIISTLQLPHVCKAWDEPSHADFTPRTAWSLFNAFTAVLKPRAIAAPAAVRGPDHPPQRADAAGGDGCHPRQPPRRGKPFQKGFDPRRHPLTTAERRRGGLATAKKFTVCGRWHLDWWDRCAAQPREMNHGPQEEGA